MRTSIWLALSAPRSARSAAFSAPGTGLIADGRCLLYDLPKPAEPGTRPDDIFWQQWVSGDAPSMHRDGEEMARKSRKRSPGAVLSTTPLGFPSADSTDEHKGGNRSNPAAPAGSATAARHDGSPGA